MTSAVAILLMSMLAPALSVKKTIESASMTCNDHTSEGPSNAIAVTRKTKVLAGSKCEKDDDCQDGFYCSKKMMSDHYQKCMPSVGGKRCGCPRPANLELHATNDDTTGKTYEAAVPEVQRTVESADGKQAQAPGEKKNAFGDWVVYEDEIGEFFVKVSTGQQFDEPQEEMVEAYEAIFGQEQTFNHCCASGFACQEATWTCVERVVWSPENLFSRCECYHEGPWSPNNNCCGTDLVCSRHGMCKVPLLGVCNPTKVLWSQSKGKLAKLFRFGSTVCAQGTYGKNSGIDCGWADWHEPHNRCCVMSATGENSRIFFPPQGDGISDKDRDSYCCSGCTFTYPPSSGKRACVDRNYWIANADRTCNGQPWGT